MAWADVKWAVDPAQVKAAGSLNAWAVLVRLANHKNGATGLCCPSIATLAAGTHLSVSSVQRALRELEARGLIEIEHQKEKRKGKSCHYRLINGVGQSDRSRSVTVTDQVGHSDLGGRSHRPPNLRNINREGNQAPLSKADLVNLVRSLSSNSSEARARAPDEVTQAVVATFGSWRSAGQQPTREFNFIGGALHQNYLSAIQAREPEAAGPHLDAYHDRRIEQ